VIQTSDTIPTNYPIATVRRAQPDETCATCHDEDNLFVHLQLGTHVALLCVDCADEVQQLLRAVVEEPTD
jgi:hypothetical protein